VTLPALTSSNVVRHGCSAVAIAFKVWHEHEVRAVPRRVESDSVLLGECFVAQRRSLEGSPGCKESVLYEIAISRLKSIQAYPLQGGYQLGQRRAELILGWLAHHVLESRPTQVGPRNHCRSLRSIESSAVPR